MKLLGRRKFFINLLVMLFSIAFSIDALAASETVTVTTAGTLSTKLTTSATSAKISGPLNGTDFKYLRRLVSSYYLTSIDLANVDIVTGGESYNRNTNTSEDLYTENDVFGEWVFKDLSKLKSLVLPNSINEIGKQACSGTGLTSIVIPDRVFAVGFDAFQGCSSLTTATIGYSVQKLEQGVFWNCTALTDVYFRETTPPSIGRYMFSDKSTRRLHVSDGVLADYRDANWDSSYGNFVGGYVVKIELEDISKLASYFDDYAYTQLTSKYRGYSDAALKSQMTSDGLSEAVQNFVLKIKNNTWKSISNFADFEKFFRIQDYKAFSDAIDWREKTGSTVWSYMGNPTGIYADSNKDFLYVFVGDDIPADSKLYIAGAKDDILVESAKAGFKLNKGANVIPTVKGNLYYIIYTADTRSMTKKVSEWPKIKIHVEGGVVNGYYDNAEQNEAKYRSLIANATHNQFTIKGERSLLHFKTSAYHNIFPQRIDKAIKWFDTVATWESELMGICSSVANGEREGAPYNLTGGESIVPDYCNNPYFAIDGKESDAGWANSSPFRTSYGVEDCVRASFNAYNDGFDRWCASHECGHNNQQALLFKGITDSSNNLFSNVNLFLDGYHTSDGTTLYTMARDYGDNVSFFERDIYSTQRMWYQLYLYYHQAGKNKSFYPELFKRLRKDKLSYSGDAKDNLLKFVRIVCDVAQEDLTDFFRVWGCFVPFDGDVDDYGTARMTVTQAAIDETLAYISKYPKNRQIMFIEDRAEYMKQSDRYHPTSNKVVRGCISPVDCVKLGQYTEYAKSSIVPSSYYHLQTDSIISMRGTGGVGFLVLDDAGKFLYASNTNSFVLPKSVLKSSYNIYSVDANGDIHIAPFKASGRAEVTVTAGGQVSSKLAAYEDFNHVKVTGPINSTDVSYLSNLVKQDKVASLDLSGAQISTLGYSAFNQCRMLSNIKLPRSLKTIDSSSFTNCTHLLNVEVPEYVTSIGTYSFMNCLSIRKLTLGSSVNNMSSYVLYSTISLKNAYSKPLNPPTIGSYVFHKPNVHVAASSLDAYKDRWKSATDIKFIGDLVPEEKSKVADITVATSGTLPTLVAAYGDFNSLKVSGPLNGTDLACIIKLVEDGDIADVDMKNATIVSGGSAYRTVGENSYNSANNTIGEEFMHNVSTLNSIILPTSITTIGKNAFSNCDGLTSIYIPDNVSSIGMDAFAYCNNLAEVTVGSGVTTMEQGVFWDSGVKNAYVKPTTPPAVGPYEFARDVVIHVKASSYSSYTNTAKEHWAYYDKNNGVKRNIVGDLDDYCPPAPEDNDKITVSTVNYSTYYNSKNAVKLPFGVKGYTAVQDGGDVKLKENYNGNASNNIVPANEPIVINALAGDYTLEFVSDKSASYKSRGLNVLDGTDEQTDLSLTDDGDSYYYALSIDRASVRTTVGFFWMNETGSAFVNGAHKAYLKLPKTTVTEYAKESGFIISDGNTTSIGVLTSGEDSTPAAVYNTLGQRVRGNAKGIVIVNGKKYVNR